MPVAHGDPVAGEQQAHDALAAEQQVASGGAAEDIGSSGGALAVSAKSVASFEIAV